MKLLTITLFLVYIQANAQPKASFEVKTSRSNVLEGQCFTLKASLIIDVKNSSSLTFHDLIPTTIVPIQTEILNQNVFYHENHFTSIQPDFKAKNGIGYQVLEKAVCPTSPGEFFLSEKQATVIDESNKEKFTFSSEPLMVKVRPMNIEIKSKIYHNGKFKMVGNYSIKEHLSNDLPYYVGDTIHYQLNLLGEGLSFPVELNQATSNIFQIKPISIISTDTIINGKLHCNKVFDLILIPLKPLINYSLGNIFSWNYLSIEEQKVKTLAANKILTVFGDPITSKPDGEVPITVVAIDVSESMRILDYEPNRLGKSIEIFEYLADGDCNTILLRYDGNVEPIKDWCHKNLSPADFSIHRKGTAIGNALWNAIQILKHNPGKKKIILIGDGDLTSGSVSIDLVLEMAKQYQIQVDCIGIGYSGIVPFHLKKDGKDVLVENTFQDKLFKKISMETGGKYLWISKDDVIEKKLFNWK